MEIEIMGRKRKVKRRKRGRPIKYHDPLHQYWREAQRLYRARKKKEAKKRRKTKNEKCSDNENQENFERYSVLSETERNL
ncbi:MAG: hypothetical protein ACTSX6_10435 [Candidatus Heimdallarchaeaceae archaeon]